MSDTEPRGSDAEIVALLRACGMDEANLDDGVRNVRKIVRAKTMAARDTEPLDLDAIEADSSEYVEMRDRLKKHDEWRTGLAEITAEHVPALLAEVRRLREAMVSSAGGPEVPEVADSRAEMDREYYTTCVHGYDEGVCAECYPSTHHFFGGAA